jgi:hypothetical protein
MTIKDQNSSISLTCSCNHISNKINMSWCINNNELFIWCFQKCLCRVNCDTSFTFLFIFIHNEGKLKTCLAIFITQLLIFMNSGGVNYTKFIKQMTHESTLTCIYMTYNYHINLFFQIFFVLLGDLMIIVWIGCVQS